MHIISFDVGIKNLAYCRLEFSDKSVLMHEMPYFSKKYKGFSILDWGMFNVSCKTACSVVSKTVAVLDKALTSGTFGEKPDYILIENQPSFMNPRMKSVQVSIHTWAICRFPDVLVHLCSPSGKNKLCSQIRNEPTPKSYIQRKQQTVKTAHFLLGESACALLGQTSTGKKDDLADSLLQAIYFMLNIRPV